MSPDIDDKENESTVDPEAEIDWTEYVSREEPHAQLPLEGKDYIALFIASLQTIFLPLVVLAILLLTIALFFSITGG